MGQGLDEVHDRMLAIEIEQAFYAVIEQKTLQRERIRLQGYQEYYRLRNRLSRAWKSLRGQDIMSYEEWKIVIDESLKG